MTTIIADLKSSRTLLEQNDIVSLVNIVKCGVRYDRNSMMIIGSKKESWEVSLLDRLYLQRSLLNDNDNYRSEIFLKST